MKRLLTALILLATLIPSVSFAAIAYDTSAEYTACVTGTSCTYSYTIGAVTNPFLYFTSISFATDPGVVTATYNGVSMTQVGTNQNVLTGYAYTFYAKGPATGTHNLVTTTSNSLTNGFYDHVASYGGVDQTIPVDGTPVQHTITAQSGDSITVTTTSSSNDSWVVGTWMSVPGRAYTAGAGTVKRIGDSQGSMMDSNQGVNPSGPYTLNVTMTLDTAMTTAFAIRTPASAPVISSPNLDILIFQ